MNAVLDMPALSGLEQVQAILAGKTGYEGIVKTLDLRPVSAEEGFVVFEGSPTQAVYNPIGSVHGGYAATLLDTAMGCAVHSCLRAGQAYTTLELKIAYHRALKDSSGPVRAEGRVVSLAKRAAFAEGKLFDRSGSLFATATCTCLVFDSDRRRV
ncbi:MAG: PaaI family thioesterase [Rhizomicrobium sp.]